MENATFSWQAASLGIFSTASAMELFLMGSGNERVRAVFGAIPVPLRLSWPVLAGPAKQPAAFRPREPAYRSRSRIDERLGERTFQCQELPARPVLWPAAKGEFPPDRTPCQRHS